MLHSCPERKQKAHSSHYSPNENEQQMRRNRMEEFEAQIDRNETSESFYIGKTLIE